MAAPVVLIALLASEGDAAPVRAAYDAAIAACPDCLELRIAYLRALRPRWGGDPTQMNAVIRSAAPSHRPALAVLRGYAAYDRCYELRGARRYAEAIAACDEAISTTPYWRYYFERGRARREGRDPEGALVDLDEALRRRPTAPGPMIERVAALEALHRDREAAEQLDAVAHLLPADPRAIAAGRRLAPALSRALETARAAHEDAEARRLQQILHDVLLPGALDRPDAP